MGRIYDLFVSGGRDSVVAATMAYEEARSLGIPARLRQPKLTEYMG